MNQLKERVKRFWEDAPCGSLDVGELPAGTRDFFEAVERERYSGDDFMPDVAGFTNWRAKSLLEVGCGLGTDLLQFARGGANVYGIDLTLQGASLTKKRLELYGFNGDVIVGDSEVLPYKDNSFDFVYSWGVIHHTPDTETAAREIVRVCKPGGRVLVMLYHRYSLLTLQAWVHYGLLRGRPFQSPRSLIGDHLESPGTKAYTVAEARKLFSDLKEIEIQRIVTRYDLRVSRRVFLPAWLRRFVPTNLGWFMVIQGAKT